MKKIYKLREWYDFQSAAERLSNTLSEEVNVPELLQLAIEGHIALSWHVRTRHAHIVRPYTDISGYEINGMKTIYETYQSSGPRQIEGIFQIDFERSPAFKDYLIGESNGIESDLVSFDGFCLKDGKDNIWQVLEMFEDIDYEKYERPGDCYSDSRNFYPSVDYPPLEELGFTKASLEAFEAKLVENSKPGIKNAAFAKEKDSLLKLVALMAYDGYGHDTGASRTPTAGELTKASELMGIQIDNDTIRNWIKRATEANPRQDT